MYETQSWHTYSYAFSFILKTGYDTCLVRASALRPGACLDAGRGGHVPEAGGNGPCCFIRDSQPGGRIEVASRQQDVAGVERTNLQTSPPIGAEVSQRHLPPSCFDILHKGFSLCTSCSTVGCMAPCSWHRGRPSCSSTHARRRPTPCWGRAGVMLRRPRHWLGSVTP
jgi:hypothetical protein